MNRACSPWQHAAVMQVIGLTGGIGAGKSTVAAMLAGHGAIVIDVDQLGREVIGPNGAAVERVVAHFGEGVRGADQAIDRPALAQLVFGDQDALAALTAISHPAINDLLDERLNEIEAAQPDAVVVLDMAVLTESTLGRGIAHPYEQVIVVEAPRDVRMKRLIERGLTEADAAARMASQADDAQRRKIATHIIENGGDLEQLAIAVAAVWDEL